MGKRVRHAVFAAALTGSMLMMAQTALADGGGSVSSSTDNGGNGEGKLEIFKTAQAQTPVTSLQWGGTYYIELQNPGTQSWLWNYYNSPSQETFNFFTPTHQHMFQGNPGNWPTNQTFSVAGQNVHGSGTDGAPYIYKITLPDAAAAQNNSYPSADYGIEVGPVKMKHLTKKDGKWVVSNTGEDEMYFSMDPAIGNGGYGVSVTPPPGTAGNLPEVPYAGIIPILVLAGGGALYLLRRRKARA